LGRDDESASDWDPTDHGQHPASSSLVHLGTLHCRVPTQVTAKDGGKVSCVCGKLQAGCQRHKEKILRGAYRSLCGYYIAMSDLARGFHGHGKLAFFYTNNQHEELIQNENSEMATLIAAQQDDLSSGDEEAADLAQLLPRRKRGPAKKRSGSAVVSRLKQEAAARKALPIDPLGTSVVERASAIMGWRTLKNIVGSSVTSQK
jgi:hypothetical protein